MESNVQRDGVAIEFCDTHDYTPMIQSPTSDEIMGIIKNSIHDLIWTKYIKNADEETQDYLVKVVQKTYIENIFPSGWLKSTQILIQKNEGERGRTSEDTAKIHINANNLNINHEGPTGSYISQIMMRHCTNILMGTPKSSIRH